MGIANLPVFAALSDKMRWHQTRQGLLTENVANAETPGFQGQDLKPFEFEQELEGPRVQLRTASTDSGHIQAISEGHTNFKTVTAGGFEVTPEGNSVELENEMMKVAQNQMDFQAATTLYTRSVRILKTALGRSA